MKNQKEEVRQDILNKLDNGYVDTYGCDLHHELCNTDYFIIGTYKAKKFLGAATFEIIEMVKIMSKTTSAKFQPILATLKKSQICLLILLAEKY